MWHYNALKHYVSAVYNFNNVFLLLKYVYICNPKNDSIN